MGISIANNVAQFVRQQIEANHNAARHQDAPVQHAAPDTSAPGTANPAASMANLRNLPANHGITAQLKQGASTQNAAQQWLAQHPGASAQDIINWGYKNGGNTYAGAAQFLKQFGIDINQLVANRQAPASGIVNGSGGGGGGGQIQPTPGGGATGGSVQATPKMQELAKNSRQVAAELGSTGWCAKGVEMALSRTYGLNISGNGNDVDNQLQKNGWKKVDMSLEDALKVPGLVLVWEKTSTAAGSKYGHTAITQGDGHTSSSDFVENDTLAGSKGRTGLSIWAPPDAAPAAGGAGAAPAAGASGKGAPASSPTNLSSAGLNMIEKYEGLYLNAYQDPGAGIWTIGYGHTGSDVKPGQTITKAEAEQLLKKDVAGAEKDVRNLVKVPLTQGQFDALVSFTFNLGAGALKSSTLLKKLNAGDYAGAQAEFGKWVHAGGKVLPGLVARRQEEATMFGNKGSQVR